MAGKLLSFEGGEGTFFTHPFFTHLLLITIYRGWSKDWLVILSSVFFGKLPIFLVVLGVVDLPGLLLAVHLVALAFFFSLPLYLRSIFSWPLLSSPCCLVRPPASAAYSGSCQGAPWPYWRPPACPAAAFLSWSCPLRTKGRGVSSRGVYGGRDLALGQVSCLQVTWVGSPPSLYSTWSGRAGMRLLTPRWLGSWSTSFSVGLPSFVQLNCVLDTWNWLPHLVKERHCNWLDRLFRAWITRLYGSWGEQGYINWVLSYGRQSHQVAWELGNNPAVEGTRL